VVGWELLGLIDDYRRGLVPLIVPLTLLKHHLNRHPVPGGCLCPAQRRYLSTGIRLLSLNRGTVWVQTRPRQFALRLE
jgi:uncharacterized protein YbgA (DUF1722 family)